MNKHYLDIDYKNMCFYEYSKVAQEGFEEHTNSAGTVSYRKLFKKGVFGVLQSVSLYDTERQGKELQLRLLLGDDIYVTKFPLNDQRGNLDNRFVEPIITMLPNLVKEQAYRIFPWSMESKTAIKKDGTSKVFYGVSIKRANLDTLSASKDDSDKVFPKFVYCKKDETFDAKKHLPQLEFIEELGSWKPTAVSVDAKRKFLVGLLEQGLKDLGYVSTDQSTTTTQPAQTTQQPAPTASKPQEAVVASQSDIEAPGVDLDSNEYDNLPF